jgi:hypothetical protein
MTLPRVVPQAVGTFQLTADTRYTIGPDACRVAVNLARREPWLAVDIETAGLGERAMDVKCVTLGTAEHAVILDPREDDQRRAIQEALSSVPKTVLHNAPFDVPILVRTGLWPEPRLHTMEDTLIYARYAEPDERTQKNLGACAVRYLGGSPAADVLTAAFKAAGLTKTAGFHEFDLDRPLYVFGAADDVLTTARLYPVVVKAAIDRLRNHPFGARGCLTGEDIKHLLVREQTINRMLIRRAIRGYRVDYEFLDAYRTENQATIDRLSAELAATDITTPAKLITYLEANQALPFDHPRTPTGKWSTAAASLAELDHPVANAYKTHKDLVKVDRDYLQKCVDLSGIDGRIHPTTNILGAQTGRSSMNTPPLQQFPGEARGIVLAEPGDVMVSIDWSAIEPVVICNLAHDYPMLDLYEAGGDFYDGLANTIGQPRKRTKVVLLGTLYGLGHGKLCRDLGVDDKAGYAIREAVFEPIPRVAQLVERTKTIGKVHGSIFTVSGRIVPVDRQASYRATNYLVQGSAYDVLAEAMYAAEQAGLGDAIYWGMHDELVVSQSAAHDIEKIMQTPPDRLIEAAGRVPVLRTDMAVLGERWCAA